MRVGIQETRWIEVEQSAIERIAHAKANNLCVACLEPLDSTRTIRGTHERCYRATDRAIKAGTWTEEQRVAEGKLLEKETPGRDPSNPVSVEAAQVSQAKTCQR